MCCCSVGTGFNIRSTRTHIRFIDRSIQVYLRQLVCVSAAWRVPQLTGFLDVQASMMGVQSQIGDVLDQVDRMELLCADLQRQVIPFAAVRIELFAIRSSILRENQGATKCYSSSILIYKYSSSVLIY